MKRMLVRYKTRPESAEENARLIGKVFQELNAKAPKDVRYLAARLGDGTFFHLVEDSFHVIPELDAFQSFRAGIKERCLEPPQQGEMTVIGSYRMLGG
jgi:hypothetical protein